MRELIDVLCHAPLEERQGSFVIGFDPEMYAVIVHSGSRHADVEFDGPIAVGARDLCMLAEVLFQSRHDGFRRANSDERFGGKSVGGSHAKFLGFLMGERLGRLDDDENQRDGHKGGEGRVKGSVGNKSMRI